MKRQPPYPDDKNFVLCGLHFEDDYFVRDFMHELNNQKRKYKLGEDDGPISKEKQKRRSSEMRQERTKNK